MQRITRSAALAASAMLALLLPTAAHAYNCDPCEEQCKHVFLYNACWLGCKAYVATNCWEPDPGAVCGNVGALVYPQAAIEMRNRAPDAGRPLNADEKHILRQLVVEGTNERWFSEDLLNDVRLHYEMQLIDEMGAGDIVLDLDMASGQTYGDQVYFDHRASVPSEDCLDLLYDYDYPDACNVNRVAEIAHELQHVKQNRAYADTLVGFGYDYFDGYCDAGFSYSGNWMEQDGEQVEGIVGRVVLDDDGEPVIEGIAADYFADPSTPNNYYAVTCLRNATDIEVLFSYRWGGEWKKTSIQPSGRVAVWRPYSFRNENRSPDLFIKFDWKLAPGEYAVQQYSLQKWSSPDTDCGGGDDYVFRRTGSAAIDLYSTHVAPPLPPIPDLPELPLPPWWP